MSYQNQKVKARQVVAPNTQTQDLGIVSEVPMGDWSATTQYYKLNTVRYGGATYKAKKQNQGVEPTVTTGWQQVWQVVVYDGGDVEPTGTYPEMTVGNATNAENATIATNDEAGNNIAEQFETIDSYIPSSASADNQLADKAFVNSSINNLAAFYIESNAQGNAFPTRASLLNATTFYNAGKVRVPTTNDYATVLADESQPMGADGNYPTTRYSYQGGTYPNGQWGFQYVVNNTSLTQAQVDAINSGITSELVNQIANIWQKIYPVGAIYISINSVSPASLFGGSWEKIAQGRTLIGANTVYTLGSAGGATTHSHTLENGYAAIAMKQSNAAYWTRKSVSNYQPNFRSADADVFSEFSSFKVAEATALGGSTDNADNLPPYLAVNMWQRTA